MLIGSSALNLFECYDTRTETWQTKPNMLMPRCSHGSVEASGLIYVCGGSLGNNVSGRVLNDCEVYDPSTEECVHTDHSFTTLFDRRITVYVFCWGVRWRVLCGMREARKNHGLVVVNSRIYAVGGQNTLGMFRLTQEWRITLISCCVFVWWLICDVCFQVDWTLWNITRSAVMSGRWRHRCPGGVWLWSARPWAPWSTCWPGFRGWADWVTSWNITQRRTNGSCPVKYVPSPSPAAWSVWWTRAAPTRRTWIPHLYPPPLRMGDCSVAMATTMRCLRWDIDLLLCQKSIAVLYICQIFF